MYRIYLYKKKNNNKKRSRYINLIQTTHQYINGRALDVSKCKLAIITLSNGMQLFMLFLLNTTSFKREKYNFLEYLT